MSSIDPTILKETNGPLKVDDLDFYALLRRQADQGRLFFNQRRAVIFDTEALGNLRQQLVDTLGEEMAMGVLTRFGYAHGHNDAKMLGENFEWETETDWLAAGPFIHTLEGIVHVTPEKIEFDRKTGNFHMCGIWLNSYEAEEHLKRYGPGDHPVCWTLTGYASGYTSGFFGQELLAIETECVGQGDERCYWEIRPVAEWGAEAEPYLAALEQVDLSGELYKANERLQKQTRQLTLLNQMSAKLSQTASVDEVFQIVAANAGSIVSGSRASVALLTPEGDEFELLALNGVKGAIPVSSRLPLAGTAIGKAVTTRQLINTADMGNSKFADHRQLVQQGLRSTLNVPLIAGAHAIGTLNVGSEEKDAYDPHDENVMLQMASVLAAAVENRRLFEQSQKRTAELEENAIFLDSIVENIPTMIFVKEAEDLRFVRWNKAGEELVGFKREDLFGKNDYDFFPKEEADFFTAKDREVLAGGKLVDIPEEPIQTAGGETRWLHTRKVPVLGSGGEPKYLLGISEDITERKQAEQNLYKFKMGIERSGDAVFLTDVDGKINYVNDAFEKIYGYSREEAIGQTPRILKSGFIPQEGYKHFWEALLAGQVVAGEIINKSKDGRLINIEGSNNPVVDDNGHLAGFLSIHHDITERKQAEEALKESQSLYQSSFDGLPQNVYRIDREGHIIFGNKTYLNTLGMSLEECLGKTAYDFFPKELADKYTVDDQHVMRTGEEFTIVESHKVPVTGEMIYVQTVKTPVKDSDGNIIGLQGVFWDITEQKAAELGLTKRAAELATVAEVGTAVSTILDASELLQTVVDLTKERFNLYHAHIYLLNDAGDTLNLAAGAGKTGQKMVSGGWSIPFEREQSLVARVARTRQGVIVNDVHNEPGYFQNPMLPDTRSELAVPIMVGDKFLGVLDVQSEAVDNFTDEDVRIQSTLAAQVAVSLENARLFEDSQKATFLLNERVKELNCLNDIGREMESLPAIPDLLQWVTERVPSALQHPDLCKVAIEFDDHVYGQAKAIKLKRQMTHGLYVGGQVQGRVYIAYTKKHDFLNEESALLGGVATRLSGYIENRRLFEQMEAARHESEAQAGRFADLNELSQQLSKADSEQDVLEITARQLANIITADRTSVAMLNAAGDSCSVLALHGDEGVIPTAVQLPVEGTAVGVTIREDRVVYTPDTHATDWLDARSLAKQGIRSSMTAPLTVGGKTVGSLNLGREQTHAYTPRDEGLALQVASLVASALENKRLLHQAQVRAHREQILREITDRIRGSVDVDTILRTTAQEVGRALDRSAFVYLGNEENGQSAQSAIGEKEAGHE